jgi:hypothetical protein
MESAHIFVFVGVINMHLDIKMQLICSTSSLKMIQMYIDKNRIGDPKQKHVETNSQNHTDFQRVVYFSKYLNTICLTSIYLLNIFTRLKRG